MSMRTGERGKYDSPASSFLEAGAKAKELALHTIKNCSNKNIFVPEYQDALTNRMIATSIEIYLDVMNANAIRVEDANKQINPAKREQRKEYQKDAILKCSNLQQMLGLAKPLFHLRGKKAKYWITLTCETKELIKKWSESDRKRYGQIYGTRLLTSTAGCGQRIAAVRIAHGS